MVDGLTLALVIIFSWILIILYLAPRISKTKRLALLGPALMVKVTKNRGILDRVSKKFPGMAFSKLSVVIVFLAFLFSIFFLFYGAYISTVVRISNPPSLQLLIGLPGLNPAIPLSYGTIALAVSLVIHEFLHGIVARKHKLKVSSVGLLFFVVPIGAFVEPDEEEITKADPIVRRRIVAAGPGINIVLAVVVFLILAFVMMPASQPVNNGLYVQTVDQSSVYSSVIHPGDEIVAFSDFNGTSLSNLSMASTIVPGTMENVTIFDGKSYEHSNIPAGVTIESVMTDFPAYNSSLPVGSVLYKVNDKLIYNISSLSNVLDEIQPGTLTSITVLNYTISGNKYVPTESFYNVTTTSKYHYYSLYLPTSNQESYKNQSFLGVTTTYIGVGAIPVSDIKGLIFGSDIFSDPWTGMLQFIALPFIGFSPVPTGMSVLFHVPFSSVAFWGMVNMFYWLFWINFLLGITNALPLVITDGAQFVRDSLMILGKRPTFKFLRNEKVLKNIMLFLNLLVFGLLLWQIIIPRVM